jgi:hypothetical protein
MSGSSVGFDLSLALLAVIALAALSVIVRALVNGVPPMPSSRRVRVRITTLLSRLSAGSGTSRRPATTVVELGSGWGTLSLAIGRTLRDATVIGYENSLVPYLFSLLLTRLARAGNLSIVRRNFFDVSLEDADLVVCYLSPRAMTRLQPKLAAELKPSALVVSSAFALPQWKASGKVVTADIFGTPIYVYEAGAARDASAAARRVDIVL